MRELSRHGPALVQGSHVCRSEGSRGGLAAAGPGPGARARVLVAAAGNYIGHQSANQAGSVAFSSVLAMFPLLLFLSAAAGFVGAAGCRRRARASRVVEYAPPVVVDALKPVIDQVLGQRSRALLTIGMLATIWAASSGAQAIRTALNKAYGVEQGLPFWQARIKVTLFTVIGTIVRGAGVQLGGDPALRLEPLLGEDRRRRAGRLWLRTGIRYGLAFVVLVLLYAILYGWLPDIRAAPAHGAAGCAVRRADVARRRGDPLLHPAQRWQARAGLRQLRRPRGDARLPLRQRGHA